MGIHTTDAIVLRHYPYRETSALVTCMTDRFGKLKGLIKGLRGPEPRYRSAMEPLTLNRIVFYDSRTSALHLISQCDLLCAYPQLELDLDVIRLAASCVELVDAVVELGDAHREVFELLRATLERLANGDPAGPAATRIHFVLRLLRLIGFQPQLDECTSCNQHPRTRGFWSARQGGLLCERCLHEDPKAPEISTAFIELLSSCDDSFTPQPLETQWALTLRHHLDEFLRWRIDRPLKTMANTPTAR